MTAGIAADVLALPGYVLWTTGASKNLPNALEWLLFLANSALWGLVLSATGDWYSRVAFADIVETSDSRTALFPKRNFQVGFPAARRRTLRRAA